MLPFDIIIGARTVIFKQITHFDGILSLHPRAVEVVIEVSNVGIYGAILFTHTNASFMCGTGTNGTASNTRSGSNRLENQAWKHVLAGIHDSVFKVLHALRTDGESE